MVELSEELVVAVYFVVSQNLGLHLQHPSSKMKLRLN
jgi:hypothetical protein